MKILVRDPIDQTGLEFLKKAGFTVFVWPEEFDKILAVCDSLIVRASGKKVDETLLQKAPNLKVIGLASTGHDSIDLEATTRAGIVVLGQPDNKDIDVCMHGNFISVAEYTMGMMLALSTNMSSADQAMKHGEFPKKELGPQGQELFEKTLGIIGLGRIGKLVALRAQAFGMKIIAYDPYLSEKEIAKAGKIGVFLADLATLLSSSDYLTLHVPKNAETVNMISVHEFDRMKKGVILINCARGGIVNETALIKALEEKIVAAAGLDVFTEEPPQSEILQKLIRHPKVLATPHTAGPTKESLRRFSEDVAYGIVKYLKEGILVHPLNAYSIPEARFREIEPYRNLGKVLAKTLFQLWNANPTSLSELRGASRTKLQKIIIRYHGKVLTADEAKVVTGSLLKEVLRAMGYSANYINARYLCENKYEIVIQEEYVENEAPEYTFLLEIKMAADEKVKKISGTILGKRGARIVEIDDYALEARPSDKMLIIENEDRPGVIGKIGTLLGQNSINIAHFHLGRAEGTDRALAIINVDNEIPEKVLQELRAIDWIKNAYLVKL